VEESKKISALGGPFGRPMWYLLDEQGNPYPTEDGIKAAELLSNIEKRRVGQIEREIAGHKVWVSTVFLVMDHWHPPFDKSDTDTRPVLYESMLFIDDHEIGGATERYHTKEEAEDGHQDIVGKVEQILLELGERNIDMTEISGLIGTGKYTGEYLSNDEQQEQGEAKHE